MKQRPKQPEHSGNELLLITDIQIQSKTCGRRKILLALDRIIPWGLYGASDGSLPGRRGSECALFGQLSIEDRALSFQSCFPVKLKKRTLALIKTSLRFPVFFALSKFPLIDVLMF